MKLKKQTELLKLLSSNVEPKISIILPINPETPQVENNILTYKNLLQDVKKDLSCNYPRRDWITAVDRLEALVFNRKLWNNAKRALIIFANNESLEISEMDHQVLAKSHVGSTFLVQDLLLPEEDIEKPDYLLNISRDRINIFDLNKLKEIELGKIKNKFSDYYSDFDANSNLNSNSRGMSVLYHGHRAKSEEQQKDQNIYYQYLDKELRELNRGENVTFIVSGLPEVLDVYLQSYEDRDYIAGIMHGSFMKLSHREMNDRLQAFYSFERVAQIEKVMHKIHVAEQQNRLISDLETIDFALNNEGVKALVSFNNGSSYSVRHNKLLIKSLTNKINSLVIYTPDNRKLPSMNAILY